MIRHICQMSLLVKEIRLISTSSVLNKKYIRRENPGVQRRVKALQKHEAEVFDRSDLDFESLVEMEDSLMDVDRLEGEVFQNMEQINKRREFKMIERKYFRHPKEPPMLTWAEREQIKFLHQNDPDKWNPLTLAESFPASPAIIKKVLRSNWKPLSPLRLREYDEQVSENWKAFHRGELKVHDLRLKEHLKKFKEREDGVQIISEEESRKAAEVVVSKPKKTEFLSLITSFKSEPEKVEDTAVQLIEESEKYHIESKNQRIFHSSNTNFTLEQLKDKLRENSSQSPDDVKAILSKTSRTEHSIKNSESNLPYMAPSERFQPDAYAIQKTSKSDLQLQTEVNSPDKIKIPKELWKRGATYRVEDTFYSDRGEFLYRVPGLKA